MRPHPTSWRSSLLLFSHLSLGLQSGLSPLRFFHRNPVYTSPLWSYMPNPSHYSRVDQPNGMG
jgi:hypothetical protein